MEGVARWPSCFSAPLRRPSGFTILCRLGAGGSSGSGTWRVLGPEARPCSGVQDAWRAGACHSRWHCFTASVSAEPPVYPLLIRDAILDLVSKSFRWSHVSEPWPNSTVLRSAKSAYCWASVREMKSRRDPPRRRGAFDL